MVVVQILISIFILGFIIFFHELFHLLAARMLKIPATDFAVGFGPSILSYQKGKIAFFSSPEKNKTLFSEDHTIYHIKCIPLGGFVAFGREVNGVIEDGLVKFKPWKRIIVALAGPIGNFTLAIICTGWLLLYMSHGVSVTSVEEISLASDFGITQGSIIKSVNNVDVFSADDMKAAIQKDGKELTVTYLSFEKNATITSKTNLKEPITVLGVSVKDMRGTFTWGNIIPKSIEGTYNLTVGYITGIIQVLLHIDLKEMQGPVGIVDMMHKHVNDLFQILFFVIAINIALAVGNLLFPFSITDGGRIVIDLIAIALRKHALNTRKLDIFCAFIMLGFMAFITILDIFRLF